MQNKVLIFGFGSIGSKHAKILVQNKYSIFIYSRNTKHPYNHISSLKELKVLNPDYIVISNATNRHATTIKLIEDIFLNVKCFIEKPIFQTSLKTFPSIKNNYYSVGYLLRFHPFYEILKNILKKTDLKEIYHIEFKSSSYLPFWRKNIPYEFSSSAKKISGGVLHDFSHELDFICSLFGFFKINHVRYSKFSKLKIKSKDYLNINGSLRHANVDISLNYYSKIPFRELYVYSTKKTFKFDFTNSIITTSNLNNKITQKLFKFKTDDLYLKQHFDIIKKKSSKISSYDEALTLLKFMQKIENYEK